LFYSRKLSRASAKPPKLSQATSTPPPSLRTIRASTQTWAWRFEAQGDWEKAQAAYQRALAIRPEEPLAANNLAYLMLEHSGNVNVALTLAQTARRNLPNIPSSADHSRVGLFSKWRILAGRFSSSKRR